MHQVMLRTGNLQFVIGLALAAMTIAVFYPTLRHGQLLA
jgi:hypothetical protein